MIQAEEESAKNTRQGQKQVEGTYEAYDDIHRLIKVDNDAILVDDGYSGNGALGEDMDDV
jgi:hypothetical protein